MLSFVHKAWDGVPSWDNASGDVHASTAQNFVVKSHIFNQNPRFGRICLFRMFLKYFEMNLKLVSREVQESGGEPQIKDRRKMFRRVAILFAQRPQPCSFFSLLLIYHHTLLACYPGLKRTASNKARKKGKRRRTMSLGNAIKALVVAVTFLDCVRARITQEEADNPPKTFYFGPNTNGRQRHKKGFAPAQDDLDPLYFVKMTDVPYTRKLASHPEGRDQRSRHVIEYVGHLEGKHRRLADTHGIEIMKSFFAVLNGFAARLSHQQVAALELDRDVISLTPNQLLDLDTYGSPQDIAVSENGQAWAQGYVGENVVVGIIDSGIWPEHPSFADVPTPKFGNTGKEIPYGPVPDSFSGSECAFGNLDYPSPVPDQPFECNNKLIAASCYGMSHSSGPGEFCGGNLSRLNATLNFHSARDANRHGTHVAGTAVGNYGVNAVVDGESVGTISGSSPRARLAVYKVCSGTLVTVAAVPSN